MDRKEVFMLVSLLIQAFEDGKITGKELKQILEVLIPDDLELSIDNVMSILKNLHL